jgi:hypothetical protein
MIHSFVGDALLKLNAHHKVSGFHDAFLFFCLFILIVSYQPLIFSKAESNFEEEINMNIDINGNLPTHGDVTILINLYSIRRMSNYSSIFKGESFKYIDIFWGFRWYGNTLSVRVVFDSSWISSIEEGKATAGRIMKRAENVWGIKLSYQGYDVGYGSIQGQDFNETYYNYRAEEEHSFEKLRDILCQYCPAEGYGKILRSMTLWENVDINLNLKLDEKWNPIWNVFVTKRFNEYFLVIPNQKYSVSFKNLTGYTEPIQSSPEANASYLRMSISDTLYQYMLNAQPLTPNMRAGWEFDSFSQDIKGRSVDDLALTFSYVQPSNTRSVITLMCMLGAFVAILISVSIFIMKIKNKKTQPYFVR